MTSPIRWPCLRELYLNYWHARTFGKPVRESMAYARERMTLEGHTQQHQEVTMQDQGGRFENAIARTAETVSKAAPAASAAKAVATDAATRVAFGAAGAAVGAALGDAAAKAVNRAGKE